MLNENRGKRKQKKVVLALKNAICLLQLDTVCAGIKSGFIPAGVPGPSTTNQVRANVRVKPRTGLG